MLRKPIAACIASLTAVAFAACANPQTPLAPPPYAGAATAAKQPAGGFIYITTAEKNHATRLLAFASSASGNVAPMRNLSLKSGAPAFAVEVDGSFWSGPFWRQTYSIENHAANGALLGTIGKLPGIASAAFDDKQNAYVLEAEQSYGPGDCGFENPIIREYAAGSYGMKELQSIRPLAKFNPIGCTSILTVDELGNAYIATNQETNGYWVGSVIQEYSLNKKGLAAPTRTMHFPDNTPNQTIVGAIATDRQGNLFALLNTSLVEYPPGSTTPKPVLPGVNIVSFALDSQANVHAVVKTAAGSYAIESFAPGSTTPRHIIAGPRANLFTPIRIAVSP
jgi:hypothetical protein